MQRLLPLSVLAATLATTALAQTVVIPAGLATVEGNTSNAFPWGRGTLGSLEIQTIYDSTHFTTQSINYPILITGLRYRANGTSTSAGGTYGAVSVEMATATVDALTPSTTFAANMAGDLTQVYSGAVTVLPTGAAQSPGLWVVDIPLTASFLYDPSSGNDLVIFSHIPPPAANPITGNPSLQLDVQSTGSLASRVFNSSTSVYPNTTGSLTTNHGVVVEVTYNPASGLYANFTANVTAGPVPTTVNFTDTTFTSDPGGVLTWDWDLDGDGTSDSTAQNPSFTYGACGAYDVSLTVTDSMNPPSTETKTGYISIGITPITPSFTFASIAPDVYQFTDTSTPTPASWAWDLDGDGTVDDTSQNPIWVYPTCTANTTVTLSVSSTCAGPWSTTQPTVLLPPITPSFTYASIAPGVFQFTDTSTPTPNSWDWDLDGDGTVDSNSQNPIWVYSSPCVSVNVTLTVSSLCAGPWSHTEAIVTSPGTATAVPFTGGNGTSAVNVGNMFDLTVTNPNGINVCAVTQGIYSYVGPFSMDVYLTEDTYIGNGANASVWRLVASGNGTSNGGPVTPGTPYVVALNDSFYMPAGNYGMAIYMTRPGGSMNVSYTNGPLGPLVNTDVTFFPNPTVAPGRSNTGLFTGSGFTPRCWNGSLHYTALGAGDEAGYGFFGTGCPGTLGVPTLTPNAPPVLGTTMNVTIDNLANNAAIMMTGFSHTASVFGPLPFDVTPYGAPGCQLRVSPDANLFLAGAGNTATWTLTVPLDIGLLGVLMFNQAVSLDTGFNAAGAVASDASGMMLGN